jgi:hypothetical protein
MQLIHRHGGQAVEVELPLVWRGSPAAVLSCAVGSGEDGNSACGWADNLALGGGRGEKVGQEFDSPNADRVAEFRDRHVG